jgi:hypothetical protein
VQEKVLEWARTGISLDLAREMSNNPIKGE